MVKFSRILIAIMFILSAIAKLLSLEFFDQLVAEFFLGKMYFQHVESMFYTQLFARVLIVGELVLGMAVLQNYLLKKVVLPSIFGMLVIFTGHLFYVSIQTKFIGGNCGCFGDIIPLDNLESIIKNVIAMLLVAFVYVKHTEMQRFDSWVPPVALGFVSFGVLWLTIRDFEKPTLNNVVPILTDTTSAEVVIDTISSTDSASMDTIVVPLVKDSVENVPSVKVDDIPVKEASEELVAPVKTYVSKQKEEVSEFNLLLNKYTEFDGKSNVRLNEGHKLLCLYSLTCSHCQQAYREIYQLDKSGEIPDTYLICYGQEFDKFYFFNQGGGEKPHILVTNKHEFDILMRGESFPKILEMKDGKVIKKWDLATYSRESVADYFKIDITNIVKPSNPNSITIEDDVEEVKF